MKSLGIILSLITCSMCFNLNTEFPFIFKGAANSYFGYSVAFKSTTGQPRALISATKGNSSRIKASSPGVVFNCEVSNLACREVPIEPKGKKNHPPDDNMWLGMSLDVSNDNPQKIVACAPRWRNKAKSVALLYPGNGICYLIDYEKQTAEQLVPFEDISKQAEYNPVRFYYAFSQCGVAAQFSKYSKHLLLGSPGFSNWIGTVATYTYSRNNQLNITHAQLAIFPEKTTLDEDTRYAGYSVTSGYFFERGNIWFAAGAPRDNFYKGRVYIYEMIEGSRNINIKVHQDGQQMGEYFGAAVLGIDVNGDNFTDLLIGAPLYSQFGRHTLQDFGRVDIFVSNGIGLKHKGSLYGLRKDHARFGNTIANLEDINQDGYNDVAIGAPYEDGSGAVYIYHGSATGLSTQHSQRIAAADIKSTHLITGFGISISNAVDIDSNNYPDVLVGAYSSDQAILFRANPIVNIEMALNSSVSTIDVNSEPCRPKQNTWGSPCFKMNFCFSYQGKHLPPSLDVGVDWEIEKKQDDEKTPIRACFKNSVNQCAIKVQQTLTITPSISCNYLEVHIQAGAFDYQSPLQFQVNYSLISKNKDFCKNCPILDVKQSTHVEKQVSFQINCRGKPCISDLGLHGEILGLKAGESLIIGINKTITLNVTLHNKGDLAYFSYVLIHLLSSDVIISNAAFCALHENKNGTNLKCEVGNPLKQNQEVSFQVKLDVSQLDISTKTLHIKLKATTISQESNLADNEIELKIPCESRYGILLTGLMEPGMLFYRDDTYDVIPFTQKYEVSAVYSPLSKISLHFSLPITTKQKQKLNIYNVTSIQVSGTAVCFGNYDNLNTKNSEDKNRAMNLEKILDVNCQTHECQMVECSASSTEKSDTAVITISGFLNVTSVRTQANNSTEEIHITSDGLAMSNGEIEKTTLILKLIKEGSLGARSAPLWVIIISSICGAIILIIIIIILAKYGFFKRMKNEELSEMKNEEKLLEEQ